MKKIILMLFVFVMFVSLAFSADITKGPWLVRPTKTSMTVMFESSLKVHARVAGNFAQHNPAFILHSGDFIKPDKYASWGSQYFEPLKGIIDRIPLFPALGNHEKKGDSFRQLFNFPKKGPRIIFRDLDLQELEVSPFSNALAASGTLFG